LSIRQILSLFLSLIGAEGLQMCQEFLRAGCRATDNIRTYGAGSQNSSLPLDSKLSSDTPRYSMQQWHKFRLISTVLAGSRNASPCIESKLFLCRSWRRRGSL